MHAEFLEQNRDSFAAEVQGMIPESGGKCNPLRPQCCEVQFPATRPLLMCRHRLK